MSTRPINGDTVCLLRECNAGSKMATNSIEQVRKHAKTDRMRDLLDHYNGEHAQLGEDIGAYLKEVGEDEKDPGKMAQAMSWIHTELKLTIDNEEKEIADLLIDGCNMGIKSLSEYRNKYSEAEPRAVELCDRLHRLEKQMADELEAFL